MSSRGSHHWPTSAHPYAGAAEHQHSTSTLASSTGEMKKTFLGRWRSAFKKEAMEVLPEQDSPLSSFLRTVPPTTNPLAIPPLPYETFPLQPTWQGISSDSDWGAKALEALPHPSHLASTVLGLEGHQMLPSDPQISSSVPLPSSTLSGITSTSPTLPSFPTEAIPIAQPSQTGAPLTYPSQEHQIPTTPRSFTGTSPYRSPSNLPPCQGQQESCHPSLNLGDPQRCGTDSPFPEEGESRREGRQSMSRGSVSMTGTGDVQRQSEQQYSEK